MDPLEFKQLWSPDILNMWEEFDINEIEKAPINVLSKEFLKNGFPSDAAPFLSFGWTSYKGKFYSVDEAYPGYGNSSVAKKYWIFGSDGGGNPICFDVLDDDKIVLLDHEQGFEVIDTINANIEEFATCLLLYKNFISKIQKENGEDAYLDLNFSTEQLSNLKEEFEQVNINIFKQSGFWRSEINALTNN